MTHVLLPAALLLRRCDLVDVIGRALVARAAGWGQRRIAALVGFKDLIRRLPGSNTYVLMPDGIAFAVFYTKVGNRLLEPLFAANAPPAPPDLRRALRVIDHSIDDAVDRARMKVAA